MTNAYALRSPVYLTNSPFGLSFLRDAHFPERKARLEFHIKSDDYFGTLATILGLVADTVITDDSAVQERCAKNLNELREDLVYLQDAYTIRRRN